MEIHIPSRHGERGYLGNMYQIRKVYEANYGEWHPNKTVQQMAEAIIDLYGFEGAKAACAEVCNCKPTPSGHETFCNQYGETRQ